MKILGTLLGALLTLIGCVWILQGVNVLPGSFMSGQTKWAVNGAIALVIGVALIWASWRRRTPNTGA